MKHKLSTVAAGLLVALIGATIVSAQPAGVVGYNALEVPPQTDAILSVPFPRSLEQDLTINADPMGSTTLPLAAGTLAGESYDGMYYVRFTGGGAQGLWSTVVGNTDNDITITDSDVAALVGNGDTFRIYKHWTVGGLFPAGRIDFAFVDGTQVLLYDNDVAGKFKLPDETLTYRTVPPPAGWKSTKIGGGDNSIIEPESMFVLRNGSNSETLVHTSSGAVPDYTVCYLVDGNVDKDYMLGSGYPVDMTVVDLGFGGVAGRQILLFDHDGSGRFKLPDETLTYRTVPPPAGWKSTKTGGGDDSPVPNSSGWIFRQSAADAGGLITSVRPY